MWKAGNLTMRGGALNLLRMSTNERKIHVQGHKNALGPDAQRPQRATKRTNSRQATHTAAHINNKSPKTGAKCTDEHDIMYDMRYFANAQCYVA